MTRLPGERQVRCLFLPAALLPALMHLVIVPVVAYLLPR